MHLHTRRRLVATRCATILIYRMYPISIIRRDRLQRLDPAEDVALATALQSLCQVTNSILRRILVEPNRSIQHRSRLESDRHCRIALSGKYAATA